MGLTKSWLAVSAEQIELWCEKWGNKPNRNTQAGRNAFILSASFIARLHAWLWKNSFPYEVKCRSLYTISAPVTKLPLVRRQVFLKWHLESTIWHHDTPTLAAQSCSPGFSLYLKCGCCLKPGFERQCFCSLWRGEIWHCSKYHWKPSASSCCLQKDMDVDREWEGKGGVQLGWKETWAAPPLYVPRGLLLLLLLLRLLLLMGSLTESSASFQNVCQKQPKHTDTLPEDPPWVCVTARQAFSLGHVTCFLFLPFSSLSSWLFPPVSPPLLYIMSASPFVQLFSLHCKLYTSASLATDFLFA